MIRIVDIVAFPIIVTLAVITMITEQIIFLIPALVLSITVPILLIRQWGRPQRGQYIKESKSWVIGRFVVAVIIAVLLVLWAMGRLRLV